jgi:DNA-directed RNA polymerase subunit H (RpoH/RPB5)
MSTKRSRTAQSRQTTIQQAPIQPATALVKQSPTRVRSGSRSSSKVDSIDLTDVEMTVTDTAAKRRRSSSNNNNNSNNSHHSNTARNTAKNGDKNDDTVQATATDQESVTTSSNTTNNANSNNGNATKAQYKSMLLNLTDIDIEMLFKIRKTVFEMLEDGGYQVVPSNRHTEQCALQTHPKLGPYASQEEFTQFLQTKALHKPDEHQAIAAEYQKLQTKIRAERKLIKDKLKALATQLQQCHTAESRDAIRAQQKKLIQESQRVHTDELDEITYNLLTEVDLCIVTEKRPVCPSFDRLFDLWMRKPPSEYLKHEEMQYQNATSLPFLTSHTPASNNNNNDNNNNNNNNGNNCNASHMMTKTNEGGTVQAVCNPRDRIAVFFCNDSRINKPMFKFIAKRLRQMQIANCVLISRDGCKSTVARGLFNKSTEHHIRIFAYNELVVNLIRYHVMVPRYYPLAEHHLAELEKRYGDRNCFPKLHKSKPVARYYGFNTGEVVAVQYVNKNYPDYEQFDTKLATQLQNFIFPVSFKIVVDE